jgi:uncharacterized membrane protein
MQPTPPKRSFGRTLNIGLYRLARNWLTAALVIVGLYVAFMYITPVLMRLGLTGPARVLYTLYSPFCHQLAFRSVFLFGEQPFYPREVSGTEMTPFEDYVQVLPEFQGIDVYATDNGQQFANLIFAARAFVGNEDMGYKTTICARDVAIYTALFIGGLIYSIPIVRRRLRPVPIWLYLLLGIAPIGIDGVSQLLSYPIFNLWPVRETSPEFRVVTGALFGFMNAWLAFPYLDASFRETRDILHDKLIRAGVRI